MDPTKSDLMGEEATFMPLVGHSFGTITGIRVGQQAIDDYEASMRELDRRDARVRRQSLMGIAALMMAGAVPFSGMSRQPLPGRSRPVPYPARVPNHPIAVCEPRIQAPTRRSKRRNRHSH